MPISKEIHRVSRPIPVIGQIVSLSRTRETLNEKGAFYGSIDIALDLIPAVGRLKGLFELFSGDVVNRPNIRRGISTIRTALDQIEGFCEQFDNISEPTQEELEAQAGYQSDYPYCAYPNQSDQNHEDRNIGAGFQDGSSNESQDLELNELEAKRIALKKAALAARAKKPDLSKEAKPEQNTVQDDPSLAAQSNPEERYFPANSAKLAALRTRRALKPVQEDRDFPNH